MNGKGSRPRPVDRKKFEANYDSIFGKAATGPEPVSYQCVCCVCGEVFLSRNKRAVLCGKHESSDRA